MQVNIINNSGFDLPQYSTPDSSGMDLRASIEKSITLRSLERILVPTNIRVKIPSSYEVQIRPRSGWALKKGISVLNAPGTIDADYTNPIGVILVNLSTDPVVINPGDRIAQAVLVKVEKIDWNEVDNLESTERTGGFGSTGVN